MFDYTAHGDAINIAARLEGANKYLGTRVCVSADTAARIPGFHGRPVGTLLLKGKRQGTAAFEPLPESSPANSTLAAYLEAYALLDTGHADALKRFRELCDACADDPLVRFHLDRLEAGCTGTQIVLKQK